MGTDEPIVEFAGVTMITAARDTLKQFLEHPKIGPILAEKGKKGGYVCFAEADYGVYATVMIGSHPRMKWTTFDIVTKKAVYLIHHPEAVMSREGRDPSRDLWGGGIRLPDRKAIIAFSGFPEHLDELFVIVLAVRLKLLTKEGAKALLAQFPNDYATSSDDGELVFL